MTVSNGKVLKVGNGNSALGNNQFVLSAHGEAIASLKSLKVGTPVVLQPRQELAKVETAGGAMVEGGTLVLHMVVMWVLKILRIVVEVSSAQQG